MDSLADVLDARLDRFLTPFVQDASATARSTLTIEPDSDAKYPGAVVSDPRGVGVRVYIDTLGPPDEDVHRIDFDALQELVIEYRAEVLNVLGPWPACPGHTHKMVLAEHPPLSDQLWWTCPVEGPVQLLGTLVS